jgi:acyl-CoA synthetase (AMP-forming)/AMP-acid ligase II
MLVHDWLNYHALRRPDATFAVEGDRRLTWARAQESARRFANALAGAGVSPGDRIAFLARNRLEYPLLYYGSFMSGAVPVTLNFRLAPPEWRTILEDAGVRLVVAAEEYVDALDGLRGDVPVERWVVLGESRPGWDAFDDWIAAASPAAGDFRPSPDDDLYQMYTSGTTGRPKGAVLTHRAIADHLHQVRLAMPVSAGERLLAVMPLFHAGMAIGLYNAVAAGAELVIHETFEPEVIVRAMSDEGIAVASLVPAMIQACCVEVPDVADRSYDALRLMVYGASAIAEPTLARALEVFGCDFGQGYGMTETASCVTFLLPEDHRRALAGRPDLLLSAGKAVLGTEVRVVDEEDRPVATGELGEIVARGPQLMRGYWKRPEDTAEALRGGWMHTGDAGSLDEEGYLTVRDRVKDMIVSGGENVYPREVEDVLFAHPDVADAAVIGVPHERWGETVRAVVVLRPGGEASAEALMDFCRGRIADFKRPRSVSFVDELPRNPSGKVLKRELRESAWAGTGRRVGGS